MTTLKDIPRPDWAKAALLACYETNECDYMTDYFATSTKRTVFLGWSRHTRDLFPELRAAAAKFAETAELATAPKDAEHREKYSMGRGYYLKASSGYSTGWYVKKTSYFDGYREVEVVDLTPSGPAPTDPAAEPTGEATFSNGVKVSLNPEKGGVEIRFPAKPPAETIETLKANGWRWSRFNTCWYHKATPDATAWAYTEGMRLKGAA